MTADLISRAEYKAATLEWNAQASKPKKPGGHYYRTKIAYLGEEYIELAFKRFYEERIDEVELADYLAIKPKNLDKLEDTLLEGSV